MWRYDIRERFGLGHQNPRRWWQAGPRHDREALPRPVGGGFRIHLSHRYRWNGHRPDPTRKQRGHPRANGSDRSAEDRRTPGCRPGRTTIRRQHRHCTVPSSCCRTRGQRPILSTTRRCGSCGLPIEFVAVYSGWVCAAGTSDDLGLPVGKRPFDDKSDSSSVGGGRRALLVSAGPGSALKSDRTA